ncbi:hypothetical protein BDF14DRAFT_1750505 [Spinellus fusiger]|nr:hypothetical protein BDF14DRAFT_1750505 [Spinellus fusiger]
MGVNQSKCKIDPNDYNKILSDLDLNIQEKELRLSDIKRRYRRTEIVWTSYCIILWIFYLAYCIYMLYWNSMGILATAHLLLPLGALLIIVYYIRKLITRFYTRKQYKEETQLNDLTAKKERKLHELKNTMDYTNIQSLLDKYDISNSSRNMQLLDSMPNLPRQKSPQPQSSHLPTSHDTPQYDSLSYQQSRWYTKLFSWLTLPKDGKEAKYALVCAYCYAYSGLIPCQETDTICYTCPQCHRLNTGTSLSDTSLSPMPTTNTTMEIVKVAGPILIEKEWRFELENSTIAQRVKSRHAYYVSDSGESITTTDSDEDISE